VIKLIVQKLEVVAFSITNTCNLNCRFCSREASINSGTHLSPTIIHQTVIDVLNFTKPRTFSLTGGEPLCHPNFWDILSNFYSLGVSVRLNTNATYITRSTAIRLGEKGVKQITLSIDSLDQTTNSILGRGTSYLDIISSAITSLKAANIDFFVKSTLNQRNLHEARSIMNFAIKMGAVGFSIGRTVPVGRGTELVEDYLLPWNNYKKICQQCCSDIPNQFKFLIDDPLKHYIDLRIDKLLREYEFNLENMVAGCSAGLSLLYVLPNGDVLSCPAIPKVVGNLYEDSLRDIWLSSEVLRKLRDRDSLKGECGRCDRRYICGGCRAAAYGIYGDLLAEDPACPKTEDLHC